MPKGIAKGRKFIAVPSELVSELNELANKEGALFYRYVADVLEDAVRAGRMGKKLREVVDFYEVMEVRKASGCVIIPQEILNLLVKKLYPKEGDYLRETWLNAGRWFGRFLIVKFGRGAFDFFLKVLRSGVWELGEVGLEGTESNAKLRLVSLTLPEENTELLMHYVKGVMESLGIKILGERCEKGMISLELRKNGFSSLGK